MANSTVNLKKFPYGTGGREVLWGVDAGTHIYDGTMVSQLAATGMIVPTTTAGAGPCIGVADHEQDATSGSDGDLRLRISTDMIYLFANGTSTDACSDATLYNSVVFAFDDHTVYDNSAGNTLPVAGFFRGLDPDGKVRVFIGDPAAMAAGASAGGPGLGTICHYLASWREVSSAGDVSNIAGNGGILASDTTPILRGDAAEAWEISWATGDVDPISLSHMLPVEFDGTGDVYIDLVVSSGTTDAATIVCETSWDGGALVSDSTSDTATKSATAHTLRVTVAAADIPDTASRVTIALTPPAHATNAIQLHGSRLSYKRDFQNV